MESEWEREKQKILNALVVSGTETFDFSQDSEVGYLRLLVDMLIAWLVVLPEHS
jgi:hypothetical protein